jgi:hypothetical protein
MMQKLIVAFINQHMIHLELNPKIHKFIFEKNPNQAKTIILIHKWASNQMFVRFYCHLIGIWFYWHTNIGDYNIFTTVYVWF